MAKIEIKNVKFTYGSKKKKGTQAIKGIDLVFKDGCAGALLGPSGCGKTTLLKIISGLLKPSEGKVIFNEDDVTNLSPEKRDVAQLFQFPVVYDSMTVFDNLAFPLRNKRLPKQQIIKRVNEIAKIIRLENIINKNTRELNASQRQLLALGRGLVRNDTSVILLDEPMTQLDINQRWFLRKELKIIQKYIKNTMIYVTHDQHEALSFAEKIVVMKDGLVLQEGDPITLYNHPINPFVGWFVGNPGMNIFKCLIEGNRINCNDFEIEIPKEIRKKIENLEGEFHLGIRAEYVKCSKKEKQRYFLTKLSAIENMGSYKILTLNAGNTVIKSIVTRETDVYEGQNIWTNFTEEAEKLKIFKNGKLVL